MIRRFLSIILCSLLLWPPAVKCEEPLYKILLVTQLREPSVLSGRGEIADLVAFSKKYRFDTLYVQIYRANQAWFPSNVGDSGPYESCLKGVGEDPFGLLIKKAHGEGIKVYAWVNMLSLAVNSQAPLLKKYGPSILTRNLKKKKTLADYKIDDQYFLEPGDLRIRRELRSVVEEILTTYPNLDGVLFDYIRYPDEHPAYGYTNINTARFKKTAGVKAIDENSKLWKDWKRSQVTEFINELAETARHIRPDIELAATGCAPYVRAYHEAFQDWPSWLKMGTVDSITLMSYSDNAREFENDISEAKEKALDLKKINIAVGAYKLESSPEKFAELLGLCGKARPLGIVIYDYDSLRRKPALRAAFVRP